MKKYHEEIEKMETEDRIHIVRTDLAGDALLAAKLVRAAFENNFDEMDTLLAAGADPRICRRGEVYGVESPLFFALKAENFVMAKKLFEAGDRLDDLIIEGDELISAAVLNFLASEMRNGNNYFRDDSKTLSEHCRCSSFEQIAKMLPDASQDELNKAFINTVHAWLRNFRKTDIYCSILQKLLDRGASIDEAEKTELLNVIERRFKKCPQPLSLEKTQIEKITSLIKNK